MKLKPRSILKNPPIKLEALEDEDKITIKILFGSVTGKAKVKEID